MNAALLLSTLGRLSVQAAVVVLVILVVQAVFRKWLTPRWRCALWLLLVARLLLPVSPPSPLSIFNLPAFRLWHADPAMAAAAGRSGPGVANAVSGDQEGFRVAGGETSVAGAAMAAAAPQRRQPFDSVRGRPIHLGVIFWGWAWLVGFSAFLLQVAFRSNRWKSRFAGSPRVFDPAIVELVEECAASLGLRTRLAVFESGAVVSPVLYGVFRPRVVLPRGFIERFNREDMRFVILHEMVHLKNGDLILNWLITGLQAVHWFNPLVWIGFERWRADRELACDAVVLKTVGAARKRDYGETLIQLLEGRTRRAAVAGQVGISAAPGELRSRLAMIMQFEPASRWSGTALLLVAGVGAACLTNSPSHPRVLLPLSPPAAAVKSPVRLDLPPISPAIAANLPGRLEANRVAEVARAVPAPVPATRVARRPAAVEGALPFKATVAVGQESTRPGATHVTAVATVNPPAIDRGPPTRIATQDTPPTGASRALYAGHDDIRVDVVVDLTDAGRKIARPTPNQPAYYLPLTVGYRELGAFVPGQNAPPPTLEVQHLLARALYDQGYRVTNNRQPPSLVLVFWWGHIAPEIKGSETGPSTADSDAFAHRSPFDSEWSSFAAKSLTTNDRQMISLVAGNTEDYQYATGNPNPKLEQILTMEKSPRHFVMVSAFDFQDWAHHRTTLLWQAHISTELAGHSLGEVLPALVATSAPMFGRETTAPQFIAVPGVPSPMGRVIVGTAVVRESSRNTRPATNATPYPGYLQDLVYKGPRQ